MPEISISKKPTLLPKDHPQVFRNHLFEGVLLFIVFVLFMNFLVLPKRAEVKAKKAELAGLNSQSANMQESISQLNSLIAQMKSAKKDISVLDEALPLNSRVTTIHVLLDSLISSSGLTLANISADTNDTMVAAGDKQLVADPYSGQRQLQTVSVNVGVTGTMEQFLNFLKSLESNARILDVSSVQITGNKNNLASFVLTIKTYFYGTAAAAASDKITPN